MQSSPVQAGKCSTAKTSEKEEEKRKKKVWLQKAEWSKRYLLDKAQTYAQVVQELPQPPQICFFGGAGGMEGGMYKKEAKEAHLVEELCGFSKLSVAQEGSQQLKQVHQELGVHVPTLHTHIQYVSMSIVFFTNTASYNALANATCQTKGAKDKGHRKSQAQYRQPSPPNFVIQGMIITAQNLPQKTATEEQILKLTRIQKGTKLKRRKWQNITGISFFPSHSPLAFKMGQVNPNTKVLAVAKISPTITQTRATFHATNMAVSCNRFSYPLSWG